MTEEPLFKQRTRLRNAALLSFHRDTGLPSTTLQNIKHKQISFSDHGYTIRAQYHEDFSIPRNSHHRSYDHLQNWLAVLRDTNVTLLFISVKQKDSLSVEKAMGPRNINKVLHPHYAPYRETHNTITKNRYHQKITEFQHWCRSHNIEPQSISEENIVQWLENENAQSLGRLNVARSAIGFYLRSLGRSDNPTKKKIISHFYQTQKNQRKDVHHAPLQRTITGR